MNKERLKEITNYIKDLYGNQDFIPLHAPVFIGNEKKYLEDTIDSTFVSYVGKYVTKFEEEVASFVGVPYAVATVNGTTSLQIALILAGVLPGDEVLTQSLTFVATANAISHCNASPVFIDSEKYTMGMSPDILEEFLKQNTIIKNDGYCHNKITGKRISACVPVHTFGHPVQVERLIEICDQYNITIVEDAAESMGSYYKGRHTGAFGQSGILSFNGNKIITCGGGGMILTHDKNIAERAKHITTTAKKPHKWEFVHDVVAFNFRLTNVNAAIGVAQMERLPEFLASKRQVFELYKTFFSKLGIKIFEEKEGYRSNYWFNSIILTDRSERDEFLDYTNRNGVMTRPIWNLMHKLDIYKDCQKTTMENAEWLEDRIVNIPSGVRV